MRKGTMMTFAVVAALTTTMQLHAQFNSVRYSIANFGANTIETVGDLNAAGRSLTVIGYARVQPASSTTPAGVAIIGSRQNGVLINETGQLGVNAVFSGRTYAEVNGPINTGFAFANPNSFPVSISFALTDQFGSEFGPSAFTLDSGAQIARFLTEFPFNLRSPFAGTLTFSASAPVAVAALRTLINERGESLTTTQTVTPLPASISAGTILLPHFATGGGWRTKVILVNTTNNDVSGTAEFLGEGTATAEATPLTLTVNGATGAAFGYTIRARSSASLDALGALGLVQPAVQVGSVRITPASGSTSPSAFAVFSFSSHGVVVSQTTVEARPPSTAFRTYIEFNSTAPLAGSIQTGLAIANNSAAAGVVNFEVRTLDGQSTGLRPASQSRVSVIFRVS